jgi:hypothetical protein
MKGPLEEKNDGSGSSELTFGVPMEIQIMTRTLVAAGFVIRDFIRHPRHAEYICERTDLFGMRIPYVIAVFDEREPNNSEMEFAKHIAMEDGKIFVPIAQDTGETCIGWNDFLDSLGGAVPTWRALNDEYADILRKTSRNALPSNLRDTGEAWQIFEDAVADGLEFVFGRRVRRLGGRRRGRRVSDMIVQTPDGKILVIDAKASHQDYEVNGAGLRPLSEYVKNQKIRQLGRPEVSAAVLIANQFAQALTRLYELNGEFLSENGIPLTFLEVSTLLEMIQQMKKNPMLRNTLHWARIFCSGGLVESRKFEADLKAALDETYPR